MNEDTVKAHMRRIRTELCEHPFVGVDVKICRLLFS